MLSSLEEDSISFSDDSGYLSEEEYEEIPDEIEIEEITLSFPDDQEYSIYPIEDFLRPELLYGRRKP